MENKENQTSIEIPSRIMREMEEHRKEASSAESFEESQLIQKKRDARMNGENEDDLWYQLAVYKNLSFQEGEGFGIKMNEILRKLGFCYCGSGLKEEECHSSNNN